MQRINHKLTIADFEEGQQREQFKNIEAHFHSRFKPRWLQLEQIFVMEWIDTDIEEVKAAIDSRIADIRCDLDTLKGYPNFSKAAEVSKWARAVEVYKNTLNINEALKEVVKNKF